MKSLIKKYTLVILLQFRTILLFYKLLLRNKLKFSNGFAVNTP
jgi:hypothetical protein